MEPLTLAAILGGAGFLKGELFDRPKENRDRMLNAEKMRYSPWTGYNVNAKVAEAPSSLDTGLRWGMGGAALKSNLDSADAYQRHPHGAFSAIPMPAPIDTGTTGWVMPGQPQWATPLSPYGRPA